MMNMDKKELILKEAEKLFAEKGYYGLGLSELLKRCEIPKGSFYYYFPGGKIQLIEETLDYSYRRMEYGITKGILTGETALASFERMADHLTRRIGEKPLLASMFLSMIAIESVYLDENVNAACRRIYGQWQKLYADFLRGFGFGEEESIVKAQAIFALIHGSLISSWIKQDPTDLQLAKRALRDLIGDR